jgi:DNA-binding transcriptional LysR family regulator
MARETVNDLIALLAVARERSFTRAAAQLGMSQPALSRIIRDLEARLGLRLLTRNTRSVAATEAGERLIQSVGPHFDGIEAGLAAVTAMRGKPAGSLRITSVEHASDRILAPAVARLLTDYPDIRVEIINDYGLSDIVAERFDAGVRLGEQVAKDMIALRIGPDFRQVLVGAPSYFANRPQPATPYDLTAHACINLRLPTSGGMWSWPFAKAEGAGRRAACIQRDFADRHRRLVRPRVGVSARRRGTATRGGGTPCAGPCRVVAAHDRLSSLLSEPAAKPGLRLNGRGAARPLLTSLEIPRF